MIIFENILENRGQTKLFKYITLGKDLDDDEIDFIMKTTDKIISEVKNDIDETLQKRSHAKPGFFYSNSTGMLLVYW